MGKRKLPRRIILGVLVAWGLGAWAVSSAGARMPLEVAFVVDLHRDLAPDRNLICRGLKAFAQALRAGDRATLFVVGQAAHPRGAVEVQAAKSLDQLTAGFSSIAFEHEETRLSAGINRAWEAMQPATSGARRPTLVLVTNGLVHVAPGEREAEMRARAAACQRWRQGGGYAVVLGVITDPRCHWLLLQLARRLQGSLVLLRSGDGIEIRTALAKIGRLAAQARQVPAPGPAEGGFDWLSALLILIALFCAGCLVVGVVQGRRHQQEQAELAAGPAVGEEVEEPVLPPPRWKLTVLDRESPPGSGRPELLEEFEFTAADLWLEGAITVGAEMTDRVFLDGPGVWPQHLRIGADESDDLFLSVAPDALVRIDGKEVIGPHREPQYLPSRDIALGEDDRFLVRLERIFEEA